MPIRMQLDVEKRLGIDILIHYIYQAHTDNATHLGNSLLSAELSGGIYELG